MDGASIHTSVARSRPHFPKSLMEENYFAKSMIFYSISTLSLQRSFQLKHIWETGLISHKAEQCATPARGLVAADVLAKWIWREKSVLNL